MKRFHWTTWAAAAVVLFYFVVSVACLPMMGLTDDDDFYIPAGIQYSQWTGRVLRGDIAPFDQKAVDQHFTHNHEHPPLAKYVLGWSHAAFSGWLGPVDGARIGTVFMSTSIAIALFVLAIFHLGRIRGFFAGALGCLLLLTLPRFFFHAHAATLDVPVAATYLWAATLALMAERKTWAAPAAGVAFGLAMATKLNGPFMVVPYIIFVLLTRRRTHPEVATEVAYDARATLRLPPLPTTLFWMAIVGPLVFWISWPWLWFDTFNRLGQYISFHFNHYGIYLLYFGQVFVKDPYAPWHAPFVLGAITVPLATSALAVSGLVLAAKRVKVRLQHTVGDDSSDRREADLIINLFLHGLVTVAVVAFSGGPKYGGAKLFMPFFPVWCLLAGYGALRLWEVLQGKLRFAAPAVAVLAVFASLSQQTKFGEYALSQYNGLTNGLAGATATGFERQYYDVAFRGLVAWLNDNAPKNTRVHFLPNNWEYVRTYKWYHRAKELRSDVSVASNPRGAQWIIITHERRFSRYGQDMLQYRDHQVVYEHRVDGTPLWTVLNAKK